MRQPHTAAGLAILCSVLLFVALACAVLHEGGVASAFDREVLAWLHARAGPTLLRAMQFVSALHAPRGIVALTSLVALVLVWRRDWIDMATVLVVVFGGAALNHLLKHALRRARPGEPATGPTDFAFPSGHVANATLLYGVVAALLLCRVGAWPMKTAVALGAALGVASVALSRLVLGAHHPSDVLAAVLVGVAWLALCLTLRGRLLGGRDGTS